MKRNLGNVDRTLRALAALALATCSGLAPLPLAARVALGVVAGYMLLTVLAGTCLGYALMGRSTCPARTPQ
jgi:hypothetical protein